MKITRIAGIAALACLALATPSLQAQTAPAAEKAKSTVPLVIVNRQIDGKQLKLTANGNWHRVEVELKAIPEGIKAALAAQDIPPALNNASVRWLNNIKVTLVAGYQPSGADLGKPKVMQEVLKLKDAVTGGKDYSKAKEKGLVENWRFYRATTTVLTLETNTPKSVFFYIPADVVKRDDISNPRPDVAYVTLEVDGKEVPIFDDKNGNLYTGSFGMLVLNGSLGKAGKPTFDKVKEIADRATRDTDGVMRPQNLITSFNDADWGRFSPEFIREDAAK